MIDVKAYEPIGKKIRVTQWDGTAENADEIISMLAHDFPDYDYETDGETFILASGPNTFMLASPYYFIGIDQNQDVASYAPEKLRAQYREAKTWA